VATLFVDRRLTIRLYTPSLTQIFNIMPVDQGRPLNHVTHRLDYEHLQDDIQQVLNTLVPLEREVSQAGERHYLMRLVPYRTMDDRIDGVVITFVDITARQQSEVARQALTEQLEVELADARQLQQISTLLIQEDNVEMLYRQILDAAIALMRADTGSIQMADAERGDLGLSLCRSIIEAHGGDIRLNSQVGQGTTVHVTLPVTSPAQGPTPETPDDLEMPASAQHGRILLIDDEVTVQRALQRLLQRSGHELALAANGREGLAALQGGAYDVILCDIRMPDLDGPGFYREVARVHPHLVSRIIFLTGDVLSPEVQTFFDQVDCPRLVKPFQAREIRQLIQHMLAG
jgi:CheY-like chemotaxis protein